MNCRVLSGTADGFGWATHILPSCTSLEAALRWSTEWREHILSLVDPGGGLVYSTSAEQPVNEEQPRPAAKSPIPLISAAAKLHVRSQLVGNAGWWCSTTTTSSGVRMQFSTVISRRQSSSHPSPSQICPHPSNGPSSTFLLPPLSFFLGNWFSQCGPNSFWGWSNSGKWPKDIPRNTFGERLPICWCGATQQPGDFSNT